MPEIEQPRIKLMTKDQKEFTVDRNVIIQSKLVKGMLEDLEVGDQCIPLSEVESGTLEKIIEYLTHYKDAEEYIKFEFDNETADPKELQRLYKPRQFNIIPDWDKEFFTAQTQEMLFSMYVASSYLDSVRLYNMLAQEFADQCDGKSVEELRAHFGIENDFIPEEEEEIRKEYAWMLGGNTEGTEGASSVTEA